MEAMTIVSYSLPAQLDETCSWCEQPAIYVITALDGKLTDYGCASCTAEHMRGNATAMDGGDGEPADADAENVAGG